MRGIIDNKDASNNWLSLIYDNPNQVPTTSAPQKYDINLEWENQFPGAGVGKQIRVKATDGIWESHFSLPNVRPQDRDRFNRGIVLSTLGFISLDNRINSGKMNFPLKVVYNQ